MHRKGELFHNKFHIVRVFLQHLPEEGLKPRAARSLIVTKDDYGDGGVRGAFKRQSRHVNLMIDLWKKGPACHNQESENQKDHRPRDKKIE
jgi:hypothetical protein